MGKWGVDTGERKGGGGRRNGGGSGMYEWRRGEREGIAGGKWGGTWGRIGVGRGTWSGGGL